MSIRLNKLLADRGIGARRKCDLLIQEGHVRVNGRTQTEPGTQIEEFRDRVEVNGRGLPGRQKLSYWVLNKPVGVITTLEDPQGRLTVAAFLPKGVRLFPVGRLDADTSGLLMLTNDGDLAHKLMHPRYGVQKFYRVRLDREPTRSQLDRLQRGVQIEPGFVSAPARARRIDPGFDAIMIEVVVHEGRFRQVRRMCEKVGMRVTGLHRVGYGPVRLGPLPRGMYRELADDEVAGLQKACSRPLNRDGSPTREVRATTATGKKPVLAKRAVAPPEPEDEGEEFEETWIAGGGFAPDERDDYGTGDEGGDDAAEAVWPARAGGRRGDAGFQQADGGKPARGKSVRAAAPAPRADAGGDMPWHAPEYRRGAKPAVEKTAKRAAPPGKLGRRAEARESAFKHEERREVVNTEDRARDRALERVRLKSQRKESGPVSGPGESAKRRFGDRRDTRVKPRAEERGARTEAPAPRGRFGAPAPRGGSPAPRGRAGAPAPRGRFGGDDAPRGRAGAPAPRGRFGGDDAPRGRAGAPAPRGRFGGDDAPRGRAGAPAPRGRFGGDDAPRGRAGAPAPRGRFGGDDAPRGRAGAPAPRGRFAGDAPRAGAPAPRGRAGAPAPRGRFAGDAPRAGAPAPRSRAGASAPRGRAGAPAPRGRFAGDAPRSGGTTTARRGGAGAAERSGPPRGKSPRAGAPAGRRGPAASSRGPAPRSGGARPSRGGASGGRRK